VALATSACSKQPDATTTRATNTSPAPGNPLTAPVDYIGALGKAQKSATKTIDTASISQAIQLFNAAEGRWPKDLNELVTEKYLGSIPAPPAGMRFQYNPATGAFRVVAQ
jgi:hypothetical protein